MADLLSAALTAEAGNRGEKAAALASAVKDNVLLIKTGGLVDAIKAALESASDAAGRESACAVFAALASGGGASAEPYVTALLSAVLDRCADKTPAVREAAAAAVAAFSEACAPDSLKKLLPILCAPSRRALRLCARPAPGLPLI